MTGPADFAKLVPGFDFLQGLMKNAGQALPSLGQWIAPTLDPVELEKRIEQLRTVQFWLEQNAKLLSATIQALEVQRMTLATLKGMNLPMDSMREAFTMKPSAQSTAEEAVAETSEESDEEQEASAAPAPRSSHPKPVARKPPAAAGRPAAPGVDPMLWWGALTKQFTELAANALKDSGADAAKSLAGQALKTAVELPAKVARSTMKKTVQRASGQAARPGRKR